MGRKEVGAKWRAGLGGAGDTGPEGVTKDTTGDRW